MRGVTYNVAKQDETSWKGLQMGKKAKQEYIYMINKDNNNNNMV